MRARNKLKIFLAILGGVAAVLLLGAGALHVLFPTHYDTRIKKTSPLYIPTITLSARATWEQRIREAVLQQLPIGSTPQEIQAFIQQHFVRIQYRVARSDDERALAHFTEPHVFIRAIDDSSVAGECRVEIYLLLTPEERLRDVVVRAIEGYV